MVLCVPNDSARQFIWRGMDMNSKEACLPIRQSHVTTGVCFWYFQMIPLTRSLGEEWTWKWQRQVLLLARVTFVHACVTCIFSGESLWGAWKWSRVGTMLLMQQAHYWRCVWKCFPCQLIPFLWRVTVVRSREALFVIRGSHVSWFFVFQMIPVARSIREGWTWTQGKHEIGRASCRERV